MNRLQLILLIFLSGTTALLGVWTDMHKVTATDGLADDWFGLAVAIDGDYAVVGSYQDSNDNGSDAGAAYIFHRSGTTWTEQAKLTASDGNSQDYFGVSVSIDGDYVVIGATRGDGNQTDSGSAYVFVRDGSNWTEQAELTASDGSGGDQFGKVSISGDYIIIGARENGSTGSAYIFHREGTTWTEEDQIFGSDGSSNDKFGQSVCIDGDYAIVGDHEITVYTGAAYIFRRSGTSWTEQARLSGSDGTAWERYGVAVSIAGDYAVVGSYMHNHGFTDNGSAYVYHRDGVIWTETQELLASDGDGHDYFGGTLCISGDLILVGAENDEENGSGSGSAYLFQRNGSYWSQIKKFTASDGTVDDHFGMTAISGNYALIGAYGDDSNKGSAYFFYDDTPTPVELSSFTAVYSNNSSLLEWTTQSETDNLGWNIYRSQTGLEAAVQVNGDLISGAGTSSEPVDYEFYDEESLAVNNTYYYWLESVTFSGETDIFSPVSLTIPEPGDNPDAPEIISKLMNHPNPFRLTTTISFELTTENTESTEILIYNIIGQKVKTLPVILSGVEVNSFWNGKNEFGKPVSSGIYFYKLNIDNKTKAVRKCLLIR